MLSVDLQPPRLHATRWSAIEGTTHRAIRDTRHKEICDFSRLPLSHAHACAHTPRVTVSSVCETPRTCPTCKEVQKCWRISFQPLAGAINTNIYVPTLARIVEELLRRRCELRLDGVRMPYVSTACCRPIPRTRTKGRVFARRRPNFLEIWK